MYPNPVTGEYEELKVDTRLTTLENKVTINIDSSLVNIGITKFNPVDDVLMVFQNSTFLSPDEEYTLDTGLLAIRHINYPLEKWDKNSSFFFLVFKNVRREIETNDGALLQDGSVTNAKLASTMQIGSLLNLTTNVKTDVVAAINSTKSEINDLIIKTAELDELLEDASEKSNANTLELSNSRKDTTGFTHDTISDRLNSDFLNHETRLNDIVISIRNFNHVGDGLTDETTLFQSIEAGNENKVIDLIGKTFVVTEFPRKNKYINGFFIVKGNNNALGAGYVSTIQAGNANVIIGRHAARNYRPGDQYTTSGAGHNLIAIGSNAMLNAGSYIKNSTAIGIGALTSCQYGRYNIAIGLESQFYVNGKSVNGFEGTRNTSVGDNSMRFNKDGYSNIAMGRNALQTNEHSNWNVALGAGSMSGFAPLDLDDRTILNQSPQSASYQTAVGTNSLQWSNGEENVAIGTNSGRDIKIATRNTAVGTYSLESLEKSMSIDGKQRFFINPLNGTYTWTGNTISINMPGHGLSVGFKPLLKIGTHEPRYFTVNTVNGNVFSVTSNISSAVTLTGVAVMNEYSNLTTVEKSWDNVAIGIKAMRASEKGNFNTAVGGLTLHNVNGNGNTAVGYLSGNALTQGNFNTSIGYGSLRFDFEGNLILNVNNSTAIGYNSRVTGSNQIQLGDGQSSLYAFGALQNRSDARDKADVRDTVLGLDYINMLRPVDYRYDARDDYNELDENGNMVKLPKDGSKKRNRYHHGLIAQEVEKVSQLIGMDFGGLQNHSVNGGSDVYSIGYSEFVAPLIKAVQELTAKNKEREEENVSLLKTVNLLVEQVSTLQEKVKALETN